RSIVFGHDESIFLYAFDLIELNSDDLRPDPLESRKATLEMVLAKADSGIRFNEHMEGDGETVFRHACKFGIEGIVSKRKNSFYPLRSIARLAQNEERECTSREARSGGRMGQKKTALKTHTLFAHRIDMLNAAGEILAEALWREAIAVAERDNHPTSRRYS